MGEAAIENFFGNGAGSCDLFFIVTQTLQNLEAVQRTEVSDLGDALLSQLLLEDLNVSTGLIGVDDNAVQMEGGLDLIIAQILRLDGITAAQTLSQVSSSLTASFQNLLVAAQLQLQALSALTRILR